ncbi:MAG: helix-turn-helix transcriptional regulator [Bacilli bacterium]
MKATLGGRIRERRLMLGLSVKELAKRARVSASYIYAIESGERGSHIDKLARIAQALETSLVELWPLNS